MEPERIKVLSRLAGYENFEPVIFKYCYHAAEKKGIELDWNGLFANYYLFQAERIIKNIELFPKFFQTVEAEHIMDYKDSDINPELQKYNINVESKQRAINLDYTCGKCKNIGVYIEKKQLRSLDEGKTTVFTCAKCYNTWREN